MNLNKMFFFIFFCLCNFTIAAVIPKDPLTDENGRREFSRGTLNQINRFETGQLVNAGRDVENNIVDGFSYYTNLDGSSSLIRFISGKKYYIYFPKLLDMRVGEFEPVPGVAAAFPVSPQLASLLGG